MNIMNVMNKISLMKYFWFTVILLFTYSVPQDSFSQSLIIEEIKIVHKDTKSFDDDILISALGVNESDAFESSVLSSNIYKLQKFYFDNGFFDAKIDTALRYDPDEKEVFIDIIIYENEHFKIDTLRYTGIGNISENAEKLLSKINTTAEGQYYDRSEISQQGNEITDMLQNNGYMNARIKPDSGIVIKRYAGVSPNKLSVYINFTGADTVFYFGKTGISISDNKYGVDKELLKEEIEYEKDEIYSKEKLLESEGNMTKVPIVQSARIKPDKINNNKVDFISEIILNDKTEIGPYAKAIVIDNVFYAGGGVQYLNKYFSEGGKVLNLSLDALINSFDDYRFELSTEITQPNVFNNRSFLTDKITIGFYNIGLTKNYYLGNLISYLQTFPEKTFYKNTSLDFITEFVRFKEEDSDIQPFTVFNSILSATLVHDNTNKVFSPSRGFFHSITVGSGGLIPKLIINAFEPDLYYSQYLKLFTSNNLYYNLSRVPGGTVFASKFMVGDIIEYGSGERVVPLQPFYKFYSGGSNSVRGWNAKTNGVTSNTSDGGNFLIEGSFEIRRQPFLGSEDFKKNITAVVFFDYGNVWLSDEDFRFDQIALAVGFGARYNLPFGPVRVDFGFKLFDPATGANQRWLYNDFGNLFGNRFVVHFGIGEAF